MLCLLLRLPPEETAELEAKGDQRPRFEHRRLLKGCSGLHPDHAEILALADPALDDRLQAYRAEMRRSVAERNERMRRALAEDKDGEEA